MIIWIIGPSGAGKTTAGRRIAEMRGAEFFDIDEMIALRTGSTVAQIFSSGGESVFRRHEWNEIIELSDATTPRVIALGAGAITDSGVRQLIRETGLRVFIDVDVDTALGRLNGDDTRPMLDVDDPRDAWQRLYRARRHAYGDAEVTVDGSHSIEDVANAIFSGLENLERPLWLIHADVAGEPTSVESRGSLLNLLRRARELIGERRFVVVTDTGIAVEYGELLSDPVRGLGPFTSIEAGEAAKSFQSAERLVRTFGAAGLTRSDVIVAFGGGVVTDLAGFAASVYMRGIDAIYIPTTLLAQVDAAIGGKTAIDVAGVRNLAGTIRQPRHVLISSAMLHTLSARELQSGFVESLKMGIANSRELGDAVDQSSSEILEGNVPQHIDEVVRLSVQTKLDVVAQDAHDEGLRLSLNLGHTFGHALEYVEPGRHAHGEAVAFGIACASFVAATLRIVSRARCDELQNRVIPFAAHIGRDHDVSAIAAAMRTDKKRTPGGLRLVLPTEETGVVIHETQDRDLLIASMTSVLERLA